MLLGLINPGAAGVVELIHCSFALASANEQDERPQPHRSRKEALIYFHRIVPFSPDGFVVGYAASHASTFIG